MIAPPDNIKLWDQWPGEPPNWYARFELYRLLGPQRSYGAAFREEAKRRGSQAEGPSSTWYEQADKWHWALRAAAWDADERERFRIVHARTLEEARLAHAAAGRKMIEKGVAALQEIPNTSLSAEDAHGLIDAGVQIESAALQDNVASNVEKVVAEVKASIVARTDRRVAERPESVPAAV